MKKLYSLLLVIALCSISAVFGTTRVIYVNPDATGAGNGTSWSDAFTTITEARMESTANGGAGGETPPAAGDTIEIWVKAGTYIEGTHKMQERVNVYGGFEGTETALEQRDWVENVTTLKPSASGTRIITAYSDVDPNVIKNSVWDGFTITGASGGAVMMSDGNILRNCIVTGNSTDGNGMIYGIPGSTIENCTISNNYTGMNGGAVTFSHFSSSSPYTNGNPAKVINCKIVNNQNGGDGVLYLGYHASHTYACEVYNTLIANNTSGGSESGGIYGFAYTPWGCAFSLKVVNSTIVNNVCSADPSAGSAGITIISAGDHLSSIVNTIIAGNRTSDNFISNFKTSDPNNVTVAFTAIEELEWEGVNNINIEEEQVASQFVNPASTAGYNASLPAYDWSLTSSSIFVNAGYNDVVYGDFDLAGNARIQQETVDLGAYESSFATSVHQTMSDKITLHYNSFNRTLYANKPITDLKLFNLQGALVTAQEFTAKSISLPSIDPGVYIVTFKFDNQKFNQKIIIQK